MRSYDEHPPLLDFLYRKPGASLPDLTEEAGVLEDILRSRAHLCKKSNEYDQKTNAYLKRVVVWAVLLKVEDE